MDRPNEPAYPRRLASALLIALAGIVLGLAAPAMGQTPGACDQYLPNCDRGDGPRGNQGGPQTSDPSQSSSPSGPDGSVIAPAQAGGAADGGGAGGGTASQAADRGSVDGKGDGPAGLSSAANAGEGDAGGGDLLGTDYPVTGWIVAVLAALAALVLARLGWGAWRRRGDATAG